MNTDPKDYRIIPMDELDKMIEGRQKIMDATTQERLYLDTSIEKTAFEIVKAICLKYPSAESCFEAGQECESGEPCDVTFHYGTFQDFLNTFNK